MREWRDVCGYEGLYQVSDDGLIKSFISDRILKNVIDSKGYPTVVLCKAGVHRRSRIHRLVAEAFIDNPDNKSYVDHVNTDRTDNRLCNLRWVTSTENNTNPLTIKKKCLVLDGIPLAVVARDSGVSVKTLKARVQKLGWSVDRTLSTPIKKFRECLKIDGIPAYKVAEKNGISHATYKYRVRQGWSLKDAVTVPTGSCRCIERSGKV